MAGPVDRVRRLNIGGREAREGWEILDAVPGPHVDHVGDAADLSRFADGSFGDVYASHVLEHFDYRDEIAVVLREWHRVLAPGGTLRVSVPDLERLCHLYLTPQIAPDARFTIMRMIFGGHVDHYDYHLAGLDDAYLRARLQEAGFHSIRRVHTFDLFRDTSVMEVFGLPISLNLVALR